MMITRSALVLLAALTIGAPREAAAAPAAPTPLAPATGASLTIPFTIAWSSVTDPSGIIGYNWQVSPSSSFSSVARQGSTNGQTQDTVSGLANGTYFWRVNAVSGAFVTGPWSQTQSFTVTGAGPGAPGTPTLDPTKAYSTFHPYELMTFTWSAAPGAATYVLQASTDPSFPPVNTIQADNIPNTTYSWAIANPEGNYFARVFAADANHVLGQPSNVITFSVFFNNPIGPAPVSVSPSGGATLTLPVTFNWNDVPNPQPSGYELQVASDSGFANPEFSYNQITAPTYTLTSLTPGAKFWRVRSAQGDASATTAAETAWSAVQTFTVSTAPPTPVSVGFTTDPLVSGNTTFVAVQLTTAVGAGGASIALTSSDPNLAPVPATIAMPANTGWTQFQMQAGQTTSATPVTITATLNGKSASGQITIGPTTLKSLIASPSTITGGATFGGIVQLTGQAPAGGASVTLSSDSPAVTPPASVFVNPGDFSVSFGIPTSAVGANTPATLSATWNGATVRTQVTLTPGQQPTSLTLNPTTTSSSTGSFGTVRVATAPTTDLVLQVASSNPAVASVPNSVTIPAGVTAGGFNIITAVVSATQTVTISVSGGGVTQSATLTVDPPAPPPAPAISALALSPSSLVGGSSSKGTVTLASAAPSGGAAVQLTSSNTAVATVPASVTVPAGATSASFTVNTATVTSSASATITGTSGGASRSAALTVSPSTTTTAALSSLSLGSTSVTGGTSVQGRVTLTAAAPAGGFVVALSSNQAAATVPSAVTVPQGSTSATFTVATSAVSASTPVTITATAGNVTRTASLTVNPAGAAVTLTVTATGRSGERVTSSPTGISVAVGSTGSAAFGSGTSITLSVSNGRDAIWSGACSSGGNKQKTCTFTITANASVSANVQ